MGEENIKQSDKKNGVNLENNDNKTYRIIEFKARSFANKSLYNQNTKTLNNIGGYRYDDNQKSV